MWLRASVSLFTCPRLAEGECVSLFTCPSLAEGECVSLFTSRLAEGECVSLFMCQDWLRASMSVYACVMIYCI